MVSPEQSLEPDQAAPAAIGKYEVHPLANFFPILKGLQRDQLEQDIKDHGLQEPIVLLEGKILEGRNRALICERLGLKIKFKHFEDLKTGKSPLDYVISSNLHRRHLNDEERIQIAADLAQAIKAEQEGPGGNRFPPGQHKKGPAAIAAAQVGVSKQGVNQELVRRKTASKTREEAMAKIAPELRDEVLEHAKQTWLRSGVSQAKGTGIPTPSALDKAHREVQAAHAKASPPSQGGRTTQMDPDRAIRRICNVVHATFDQENYCAVRTALETGAWRLSEQDLIGIATVSDGLIPKLIDCIRLLPAKIHPVHNPEA
jgi:hypothetical protein